jgi:hypothetical protein
VTEDQVELEGNIVRAVHVIPSVDEAAPLGLSPSS